jgi:hypothetical protein
VLVIGGVARIGLPRNTTPAQPGGMMFCAANRRPEGRLERGRAAIRIAGLS